MQCGQARQAQVRLRQYPYSEITQVEAREEATTITQLSSVTAAVARVEFLQLQEILRQEETDYKALVEAVAEEALPRPKQLLHQGKVDQESLLCAILSLLSRTLNSLFRRL
jgi:hypothetical protein